MTTHPLDCDCDAYACQMRAKGVHVNAGAAASTRRGSPGSNAEYNGWERGYATVERPGGTRMPIINEHGNMVRMKEAAQRAPEIDKIKRRHAVTASTQGDA